jgi:class 3 adenylate cyclase
LSERPRILIVDDDPMNIDILEQELDDIDCDTDRARSGEEALEKIGAHPPDLILLDVMMPGLDGIAVCRMLSEAPSTNLIPVIIVTALDAIKDRIRGIDAGAADFLSRPVNSDELRARIRACLKQKHAVDNELGKLEQARDYLANYAPGIVRRLVEEGSETPDIPVVRQDVSILFADICGYTRLGEVMRPGDLHSLIERYFSAFLDCIHKDGGDLTETTGDGVMVVVRASETSDHAGAAIRIAQSLMRETQSLNSRRDGPPVALHIGVNSGPAVAGTTRFHGVSGTRWVYTAYGNTPNLAARLMEKASPGEILVGPETAGRTEGRFPLEFAGMMTLKNVAELVAVHRMRRLDRVRISMMEREN